MHTDNNYESNQENTRLDSAFCNGRSFWGYIGECVQASVKIATECLLLLWPCSSRQPLLVALTEGADAMCAITGWTMPTDKKAVPRSLPESRSAGWLAAAGANGLIVGDDLGCSPGYLRQAVISLMAPFLMP